MPFVRSRRKVLSRTGSGVRRPRCRHPVHRRRRKRAAVSTRRSCRSRGRGHAVLPGCPQSRETSGTSLHVLLRSRHSRAAHTLTSTDRGQGGREVSGQAWAGVAVGVRRGSIDVTANAGGRDDTAAGPKARAPSSRCSSAGRGCGPYAIGRAGTRKRHFRRTGSGAPNRQSGLPVPGARAHGGRR